VPSRKIKTSPWWFTPNIFQIMVTPEAIEKSELPSPLINSILVTMVHTTYTTRPRKANKSWVESVYHDGVKYLLTCYVDDNAKMIVVTYISAPKTMKIKPKKR